MILHYNNTVPLITHTHAHIYTHTHIYIIYIYIYIFWQWYDCDFDPLIIIKYIIKANKTLVIRNDPLWLICKSLIGEALKDKMNDMTEEEVNKTVAGRLEYYRGH